MPKPSYAFDVLAQRIQGLQSTTHNPNATLRTDYMTFAHFAEEDTIKVRLNHVYFATVKEDSVAVWYTTKSNVMHRRMNEVLHHMGWAVVNRNDQWTLLRRDRSDDSGVVHPFPPDVEVTVTRSGLLWFQ